MSALATVVCTAVALPLLGCAAREAVRVIRLHRHGVRTRGTVIGNVLVRGENQPHWAPVIGFVDRRGHPVRFEPSLRGSAMRLETGRTVPVIYPPDDPRRARIAMRRHTLGPLLLLTCAGAVFLGLATANLLT